MHPFHELDDVISKKKHMNIHIVLLVFNNMTGVQSKKIMCGLLTHTAVNNWHLTELL